MTRMSLTVAKKHPFLWMKYICGIRPYDYQWKMLDHLYRNRRVACVTSRQIGKSFVIAAFSFWAARNNIFPVGIDKRTYIKVVSKTEDQAKDLLNEVAKMINLADNNYALMTKGTKAYQKKKFSDELTVKITSFKIEFAGGVIECIPPTGKVRGNSLSFLFIDEGDFLNSPDPDYFFYSEAMPTVKKTEGSVFVFSTPKGTPSYFQDLIRPNDEKPAHGWKRIWYPWTIYEDDWENGWNNRKEYLESGKELDFKVEYEASFSSGRHSFFMPDDIDKCVIDSYAEEFDYHTPVTAGLDFGDTHSRTVITVVAHDKTRNKTRLVWYKEFEAGYENTNLPAFFKTLKNRYTIKEIVADDCVGGKSAIELLRQDGWNITPFVFKRDKHLFYEYTRSAFANGRIELYKSPALLAQLKSIEESTTPMGNTQIKKAKGMNDDICDSFVMAVSPFVQPMSSFERFIG